MKKIFTPALLVFFIFGLAACDFLDLDKDKPDKAEDNGYLQVYAEQAQNVVLSLWDKGMAGDLEGGKLGSVSTETDSLIEVCAIKPQMDAKAVRPILTVNFGSFRCEFNYIIRQGEIKMELLSGTGIDKKNSVVKFTYTNFRVTDTQTNKYVEYNGSKIITNMTGGVLTNLVAGQPELIHKVRSENFHIFYSGSSGDIIKNTARRVTFTKLDIANNYQMIAVADTTINGMPNISDWGTLRNGTPFYQTIDKPVFYESCSMRCKYIKGERKNIVEGGRETTIIFGVDKTGVKQSNCSAYGNLVYYFDAEGDSIATIIKNN